MTPPSLHRCERWRQTGGLDQETDTAVQVALRMLRLLPGLPQIQPKIWTFKTVKSSKMMNSAGTILHCTGTGDIHLLNKWVWKFPHVSQGLRPSLLPCRISEFLSFSQHCLKFYSVLSQSYFIEGNFRYHQRPHVSAIPRFPKEDEDIIYIISHYFTYVKRPSRSY